MISCRDLMCDINIASVEINLRKLVMVKKQLYDPPASMDLY